jgi:methylated-DNA-[protein]-cysteine S-methyltransferase
MTTIRTREDESLIDGLRAAFTDASSDERLHDRLADLAEREELLDVAYRTVDSPFGPLLLAATAEGLVRVAFDREDHDAVLTNLAVAVSPRILRTPRRLEDAARQLDEYFAGRRRAFEVPLDLRLARGFRRSVLVHLRDIPYGNTRSYASVARAAGKASAIRAAASACSHNPLPLVVPCHRVVRSDGAAGEYLGGSAAKQALLAMEAAA